MGSEVTKSLLNRVVDFFCPIRAVERDARADEAARKARVAKHDAEWLAAHPDLAAQGCPPPPTADSMTEIGCYFGGVFYKP